MAVMKKKGGKSLPPISTASLPDVIFMILFFFMISTTMRDQELLVRYKLPTATEVQKLEKKSLVSFIHIGQPTPIMQAKFGTAPRIQLNDSYRTEKDILDFIAAERDKLNESDRALMTVCLKADDQTKMGIIIIANYKSNAFPEVANNLILDGHTLGAVQAVITDNAWNKLTENQQAAVMEAAADTQAFNADLSETAENKVLDELKSSGCNVVDVPDKAPWQEACAKVISENTSDQAELYQQLLDMKA